MSLKRAKSKTSTPPDIHARVDKSLKMRLTNYRNRPDVKRSEGYVLRQAVEQFLEKHASETLSAK